MALLSKAGTQTLDTKDVCRCVDWLRRQGWLGLVEPPGRDTYCRPAPECIMESSILDAETCSYTMVDRDDYKILDSIKF
ncbi:unnamed protein product [Sphacelaria rigidula]